MLGDAESMAKLILIAFIGTKIAMIIVSKVSFSSAASTERLSQSISFEK